MNKEKEVEAYLKNELPEEEKLKDLRIIMEHYHIGKFDFDKSVLPKVTVYKLVIENMTGKRRNHARQI